MTRGDPGDADAWLRVGETLIGPFPTGKHTTPEQARERIAIYSKASEANP